MNKTTFNSLCQGLGLQNINGAVYFGVIENWPLALVLNGRLQIRISLAETPDGSTVAEVRKALKGRFTVGVAKKMCTLQMKESAAKNSPADEIYLALAALKNNGIRADGVCPLCGRAGCDSAAMIKDSPRTVHRSCLQVQVENVSQAAQSNSVSGSYLLGIIGAVLGMLVGIIPSVISILAADTEYSLLFALVPICAYFGYKLFRGKMDKMALVVSVAAAVLGVFLLNFVVISWVLVEEYYESITPGVLLSTIGLLITDAETWGYIAQNSITEFIFAALGIFISWRLISQTSTTTVINAQQVLDKAVPLNNYIDY